MSFSATLGLILFFKPRYEGKWSLSDLSLDTTLVKMNAKVVVVVTYAIIVVTCRNVYLIPRKDSRHL